MSRLAVSRLALVCVVAPLAVAGGRAHLTGSRAGTPRPPLAKRASLQLTTPTLEWNRVSGAAKFELQVDNNSDFSSTLSVLTTTNGKAVPTSGSRWATSSGASAPSRPPAPSPPGPEAKSPSTGARPRPQRRVLPSTGSGSASPMILPCSSGPPCRARPGITLRSTVTRCRTGSGCPRTPTPGPTSRFPTPQAPKVWHWRVRAETAPGMVSDWSAGVSYEILPLAEVLAGPQHGDRRGRSRTSCSSGCRCPAPRSTSSRSVSTGLQPRRSRPGLRAEHPLLTDHDLPQRPVLLARPRHRRRPTTRWPGRTPPFPSSGAGRSARSWSTPADQLSPAVGDDFYYQWTPVRHATRYQLDVGPTPTSPRAPSSPASRRRRRTRRAYRGSRDPCMPGQGLVTYWRVRALDLPADVEGIDSPDPAVRLRLGTGNPPVARRRSGGGGSDTEVGGGPGRREST